MRPGPAVEDDIPKPKRGRDSRNRGGVGRLVATLCLKGIDSHSLKIKNPDSQRET